MDETKTAEPTPKSPEAKSISTVLQTTPIALDTYDDIFSDFDPSPYETRVLSDDFLIELRKRHADTKVGDLTVNFTLPGVLRSEKVETLIKKRIRDHFRSQLAKARKTFAQNRKKGFFRLIIGILVLLPAIVYSGSFSPVIESMLSVVSWYLVWTGLDRLLEIPAKITEDIAFYEKFLRAKYNFISEETVARSISESAGSSYG